MRDLEYSKLYWLDANVVLVNEVPEGSWEVHRIDGKGDWQVGDNGNLRPLRWERDHWEVSEQLSHWNTDDLIRLSEEQERKHCRYDLFILPSGSIVPVAALFPGRARGVESPPPRVLWLDDYVDRFIEGLSPRMRAFGIDIVACNNNDDALILLEDPSQRFDLILQDLQRPAGKCLEGVDTAGNELTGLAFYEICVRKARPWLPSIFLTAVASNPAVQQMIERIGHCRAISKPLDMFELVQTIHELV